jgi:hypothetical protein
MKNGCSESVHDTYGVGFHQCSYSGLYLVDGKWYCTIHNPAYVKKRREKQEQKWKAEWSNKQAKWDRAAKRDKLFDKMLKTIRDLHSECHCLGPIRYKSLSKLISEAEKVS